MLKTIRSALFVAGVCLGVSTAVADEFDHPSEEFTGAPAYTDAEIQRKIQEEMAVSCQNNLCAIVGTDDSGHSFSVSFQIGYGNSNMYGGNGSNGVVIVGNPYNNGSPNGCANCTNASITVTYKTYSCHSVLRVTPAIYRFVNTYMYNMAGPQGAVRRNFSPADQTVILFYTTMLNKVASCGNNGK